ncbi:hypothetical protein GZ77_09300 [Endozoicomonas montiporae]|uniref:Uncharacterized protein n=2 Tax=Endozoicomonas montiporae TaxID=1027273 RepID=A0A081N7V4_9GAMM|nr:hypothetical protein [Endozoicomonas montiporae]AMO55600.1 hypothetical protein EZMO1_1429 [Endozoicomonas montiporae CL-33]KEQ14527.1 hypothetical protein GZ77_09300 [Endozoicomonas montiporae]
MKTEPKAPLQTTQTPPTPEQANKSAQSKKAGWQGWRIKLDSFAKKFLPQIKPSRNSRPVRSYQITKVETDPSNSKTTFKQLLEQTTATIQSKTPYFLSKEQSQNIASAFLVANGLAVYTTPSDKERTDFTIKPVKNKTTEQQLTAMNAMINRATLSEMINFHTQDNLVIPRKHGVLKGTRQLISGQKRRFNGKAKRHKIDDIPAFTKALVRMSEKLSNPESVYVVVFQDGSPENSGHAALVIGGKGGQGNKPQYVSHLGMRESALSGIKATLPGSSITAASHTFQEDCVQFGIPDYVVELKGLDRDKMVSHMNSTKDKGYNLTRYNCSTKVGNLLLAGLPEQHHKGIHKPHGFWTPYDVTVMAQQLWKEELTRSVKP